MKEIQPWGVTYYTVEEGSHTSFNTNRAKIDLITNPYYGRMLFIDGVLQSTSSDEKIYHSELIKTMREESPRTVLIVGGAEGALARQVLSSVSKVVMVDWDEELVHAMKSECFSGGAFSDPRLTLVHEDIFEFIKHSQTYDYILLDLLDPSMNELDWFLEVCRMCLQRSSKISMNVGGDKDVVEAIINSLDIPGSYITKRTIQVPSFQQEWYLLDIELISCLN